MDKIKSAAGEKKPISPFEAHEALEYWKKGMEPAMRRIEPSLTEEDSGNQNMGIKKKQFKFYARKSRKAYEALNDEFNTPVHGFIRGDLRPGDEEHKALEAEKSKVFKEASYCDDLVDALDRLAPDDNELFKDFKARLEALASDTTS